MSTPVTRRRALACMVAAGATAAGVATLAPVVVQAAPSTGVAAREYSPEARRLSLALLRAVIDASDEHPGDEPAILAAASATRERLFCQLIDQHGYERGQIIIDDALELSGRLVDALSEQRGLQA